MQTVLSLPLWIQAESRERAKSMSKMKRANKTSSIGEILNVIVVQLNFLQLAISVVTSTVRFHLSLPYASAAVVKP